MQILSKIMPGCHQDYLKTLSTSFGPPTEKIDSKNCFVILDKKVFELHKEYLYSNYINENIPIFLFEAIEQNKTRPFKEQIEDFLFRNGCKRDSKLLVIGGGVTSDLAGFVAATFMRGIDWVVVPTTLLAMVDAAIGGKTGINTSFGKNVIGAIHMPQEVRVDYAFLKTLPSEEKLSAMAEIIKYGLIYDRQLCENLEEGFLAERDIPICIKIKEKIVSEDFLDTGIRKILNFGHTIAHAIESATGYTTSHGFAVAKGLLIESFISMRLGYLSQKEFNRIKRLLEKFQFPSFELNKKKLKPYLAFDKKNRADQVHFVLLVQMGKAQSFEGKYTKAVDESIIEEGLALL